MNRVKFYSFSDWSVGRNLYLLEKNFESYKVNNNPSINDIIEFYNIQQYIENEMYLPSWSDNFKSELKEFTKSLTPIINRYFHSLSSEEFKSRFHCRMGNDIFKKEIFLLLVKYIKYYS